MKFRRVNSELKYGNQLPVGTVVYYIASWNIVVNPTRRSEIGFSKFNILNYAFVYFPADGLYATHSTRRIWEQNICFHPHCTLFKMLQEKLRI